MRGVETLIVEVIERELKLAEIELELSIVEPDSECAIRAVFVLARRSTLCLGPPRNLAFRPTCLEAR
jgi:hypothetical protein